MDIDFVGVKVGDVNGDLVLDVNDNFVDTRIKLTPLVMEYDNIVYRHEY